MRRHSPGGLDDARTWPGAVGALLAAGALSLSTGSWGVVAGAAVVACWHRLPAVFAFAVGQILLVASMPTGEVGTALLAGEVGLFALLVGPLVRDDEWVIRLGVAATVTLGLALVAELALRWANVRVGALALVAAFSLLTYGVHRYELVTLGLVEEDV